MTSSATPAISYQSVATPAFRVLLPAGRLGVPCGASAIADAKAPGTAVQAGDMLTNQLPHLQPAVLAPCDGRVAGTGMASRFDRRQTPVIYLEPDPGAQIQAHIPESTGLPPRHGGETDLAGWIDRLRAAGIGADRLTSPDLLGQLYGLLRRPADTLICNVLEADPFLPLQATAAAEWPAELAAGVTALAHASGAGRLWAAVGHDVPPASLKSLEFAQSESGLRLVPLRNAYPQCDPTLVLRELAGRRLRPGRLPSELGVLLVDALAAIAVGRYVLSGKPMLSVPLAVYDHSHGHAHFVIAPMGMGASEAVTAAGVSAALTSLRGGNPLRELWLDDQSVVSSSELIVYASLPEPEINPDPCIRCAWCTEGCPVRIQPAGLLDAAQEQDPILADEYGLPSCIECGICAYVCPSHLPLLKAIRVLRQK